jgi:hypothetical protein
MSMRLNTLMALYGAIGHYGIDGYDDMPSMDGSKALIPISNNIVEMLKLYFQYEFIENKSSVIAEGVKTYTFYKFRIEDRKYKVRLINGLWYMNGNQMSLIENLFVILSNYQKENELLKESLFQRAEKSFVELSGTLETNSNTLESSDNSDNSVNCVDNTVNSVNCVNSVNSDNSDNSEKP